MCAVKQTNYHRVARISFQNRRCRVSVLAGTEYMRRVVFLFQTFYHRFAPVTDSHNAGVVVRTGMLRRIERFSVFIKQQCKVMDKHCKLTIRFSVCFSYNGVCSAFQWFSVFGIKKNCSCRFNKQCTEHTVLLMRISEKMVVEKYRTKFADSSGVGKILLLPFLSRIPKGG